MRLCHEVLEWCFDIKDLAENASLFLQLTDEFRVLYIPVAPKVQSLTSMWHNYLCVSKIASGAIFGTEKNRGILYQARSGYNFTKNIAGYIRAEYLV